MNRYSLLALCIISGMVLPPLFGAEGVSGSAKTNSLPTSVAKSKLKVAVDGFPSGQDSAEGVAADLMRAFIKNDSALFKAACLPSYASGETKKQYDGFIKMVADDLDLCAKKNTPEPDDMKRIHKLYAARQLSANGPASWGYATYNYHEVMFVDVEVELNNGKMFLNRTLVVKSAKGKWFVLPCPGVDKLISFGLNSESKSTIDFKEVYDISAPQK